MEIFHLKFIDKGVGNQENDFEEWRKKRNSTKSEHELKFMDETFESYFLLLAANFTSWKIFWKRVASPANLISLKDINEQYFGSESALLGTQLSFINIHKCGEWSTILVPSLWHKSFEAPFDKSLLQKDGMSTAEEVRENRKIVAWRLLSQIYQFWT